MSLTDMAYGALLVVAFGVGYWEDRRRRRVAQKQRQAVEDIAQAAINRLRLHDAFVADALDGVLDEALNGTGGIRLEEFAKKYRLGPLETPDARPG